MNKLLYATILLSALVSCEKERSFDTSSGGQSNNSVNIQGNWKFLGMSATTESTITGTEPGVGTIKTVSYSSYTSTDNSGTVKIEASKMTGNALAYSVNSTVKGYLYENNVLIDSVEAPFVVQYPPTNSSANYRRIGSDSIYFEGGGTFMNIATGASSPSQPNGARIKLEGNKLIMTTNAVINKTIDTLGLRLTQVSKLNGIITLEKL